MVEINHIVNDYVEVQPQQEGMIASKRFDISDIDFGLLVKEFSKHKSKIWLCGIFSSSFRIG